MIWALVSNGRGLCCDNDQSTVRYLAYYTAAQQINKYTDVKYWFYLKWLYIVSETVKLAQPCRIIDYNLTLFWNHDSCRYGLHYWISFIVYHWNKLVFSVLVVWGCHEGPGWNRKLVRWTSWRVTHGERSVDLFELTVFVSLLGFLKLTLKSWLRLEIETWSYLRR